MPAPTLLKLIEDHLSQKGFDVAREDNETDLLSEILFIYLGRQEGEDDLVLAITSQEQQEEGGGDNNLEHFYRLQFELAFPIQFKDDCAEDLASTLAFLNRTNDFPGFEMDEGANQIYHRYVAFVRGNALDMTMIEAVIGIQSMQYGIFHEILEKISQGELTFVSLLETFLAKNESPQEQE